MRTSKYTKALHHLQWDIGMLFFSIFVAIMFAHLGVFTHFITLAQGFEIVGAFVAGIFFTSMFTVAAASVAFVEIGTSSNIVLISLVGALGALFGDMLLFLFIRDTLTEDLKEILKRSSYKKFVAFFHGGFFRWLSPILGGLIIASPLPDELGLALMGMSRLRTVFMLPLTFGMNFLGIYAILAITTHW